MKRIRNMLDDIDSEEISILSKCLAIPSMFVFGISFIVSFIMFDVSNIVFRTMLLSALLTIPAFIESHNLHKDNK